MPITKCLVCLGTEIGAGSNQGRCNFSPCNQNWKVLPAIRKATGGDNALQTWALEIIWISKICFEINVSNFPKLWRIQSMHQYLIWGLLDPLENRDLSEQSVVAICSAGKKLIELFTPPHVSLACTMHCTCGYCINIHLYMSLTWYSIAIYIDRCLLWKH